MHGLPQYVTQACPSHQGLPHPQTTWFQAGQVHPSRWRQCSILCRGESGAPTPAPAVSVDRDLAGTPGVFTAATEADCDDSSEEFDYKGKYEGSVYNDKPKSNVSVYPNTSHATAEPLNTSSESTTNCCRTTSSINPPGVQTTPLPKHVLSLLQNPPAHSTALIPWCGSQCPCCRHWGNGPHDPRQKCVILIPSSLWSLGTHGQQLIHPHPWLRLCCH